MHTGLRADDELAAAVGQALAERGARVAVAETTAGGLISARILSVPGASAWFERGVVVYGAGAKTELTGVDEELLRSAGSVSAEAVQAMAVGLKARTGVDVAVAESGIAGPQGTRRSAKPTGTVVIAVAGPGGAVRVAECQFPGDRVAVMGQIAQRALEELLAALHES